MKSSKRTSKFPSKRSATPAATQRRSSMARQKASKGKKIHTEPLPSPNSSFTEELTKLIRQSINSKTSSRNTSPVYKIKLSLYLKLEQKLWEMVKNVQDFDTFHKIRQDFWQLASNNKIWEVEDCFKELKTRKSVRKALILQLSGAMLASELYNADDAFSNLKNLMLFIHQNYIEVLSSLHSKVRLPASNMLKKLKDVINLRKLNTLEKNISLSQNNEILSGLLKEICKHFRACGRQSALSISIFTILKTVNKLTYPTVREAIEQALSVAESVFPRPSEPYLPPCPSGTYTLVLDLDETLVHFVQSEDEGTVFIRPGCEEFLKSVSEWFEIVVFTAGLQDVI
jgi:CTD small phosphatase-like protein 2